MTEQMISAMCQTNGLKEVTTNRQRKNGTRAFVDIMMIENTGRNVTDLYTINTRSGYIRRRACIVNAQTNDLVRNISEVDILNPRDTKYHSRTMIVKKYRNWSGLNNDSTYADVRIFGSDHSILMSMLAYMNYRIFVRRMNSSRFSHLMAQ